MEKGNLIRQLGPSVFQRLFIGVISLFLLSTTISCSREVKTSAANIKLGLPESLPPGFGKVGAASADPMLSHVVINITGPGIGAPKFFSWDSNEGRNAPPAFFTVNGVPGGDGRLIQVLAIYSVDGGGDVFFYGDSTVAVTADTNVSIVVNALGNSAVGEGTIIGRYLTSAASGGIGPSGKVTMRYTPPGKPTMIIHTSEIFGGWFRLFALEQTPFEYVLDNGSLLFGQPTAADSAHLLALGVEKPSNMRVKVPLMYRQQGDPGSDRIEQKPSKMVLGWFGPASAGAGKKICYKNSSASIPGAYVADTGSSTLNWNPIGDPTEVIIDPANGGVTGGVAGGALDSEQLCTSTGTRFVDYLSLDDGQLANNDSVLAFRGPYQLSLSGGGNYRQSLTVTYSANALHVNWKYLPGVFTTATAKGVDGSEAFVRILPSNFTGDREDFRMDDGTACGALHTLSIPFVSLGSKPAVPGQLTEAMNISTGLPAGISTAMNEGRVQTVVCPYVIGANGKSYYTSAAIDYGWSSGGGGGGPSPATKMVLVPASGATQIGHNICTPMFLQAQDASNHMTSFDPSTQVTFSTGAGDVEFYNSNYCSGPITGPQYPSSAQMLVYVKSTFSGTGSRTYSISATNGITTLNGSLNFVNAPTIVNKALVIAPTSIKAGGCYPVSLAGMHNGSPSIFALFSTYYSFNWPTSGTLPGIQFYYGNDQSCMGTPMGSPSSGLSNTGMGSFDMLNFRYVGAASSINIQPTSSFGGPITGGTSISVTPAGAPASIMLGMPSAFPADNCLPMSVMLMDASYGYAFLGSPMTISLDGGDGEFYDPSGSNCSCGGGAVSSVNFAAGDSVKLMCYKSTALGMSSVSAESTTPVALTGSMNINVLPAQATHFGVKLPGQTFANGSGVSGSANPIIIGQSTTAHIYALTNSNNIDLSYNGYMLTNINVNLTSSLDTIAMVNFVDGEADLHFTPIAGSAYINIDVYSGMISGNGSASRVQPADRVSIYMSYKDNLIFGGCQILALIPENTDGFAPLASPLTLSVTNTGTGDIYVDNTCTTSVGGNLNMTPSTRITALYYKKTSPGTDQINVSGTGLSATNLTLTIGSGSIGSPYKYMFTGRTTSVSASVCQPYIVSIADANGQHLTGVTAAVSLQVNSGGGTAGTFDDQTCDWPYSGAPTNIVGANGFEFVYLTALVPGSTNILQASGPWNTANQNVNSY